MLSVRYGATCLDVDIATPNPPTFAIFGLYVEESVCWFCLD